MKQSAPLPIDENPRPREVPDPLLATVGWPVTRTIDCRPVVPPVDRSFTATLEARRSCRVMIRAPLGVVVNAVAFATRPRQAMEGDYFERSRRPSPSAGAIHPVEILFINGTSSVLRYVAVNHQIEVLRVSHQVALEEFVRDCHEILPLASGTAIVLVGDMNRVSAFYERAESFLWRDGGVLMQTLALVATAYRLAFCPLGILGDLVVRSLGLPKWASAVGVAMIGRRDEEHLEQTTVEQIWRCVSA